MPEINYYYYKCKVCNIHGEKEVRYQASRGTLYKIPGGLSCEEAVIKDIIE
jgi:hypothetical protein